MSASELFADTFGGSPTGVFSAPGRVNLIGEHTDYNDGLVLPFAIDYRATVAVRVIAEPELRLVSAQRPGGIVAAPLEVIRPGSASATGWPAYVFGVAWALREAGIDLPGAEIAIDSSVPPGAGLSSSAALECATALALTALAEVSLTAGDIARLSQRAENEFVGVPCGLMDQMASAACQQDHLLFFDIGASQIAQVPFSPQQDGLQILVIDTKAHHSLADGEYARRRASCERAAQILGLGSLRDITDAPAALAQLAQSGDPDADTLIRRVRHVCSENDRVATVVALLSTAGTAAVDWVAVGAELTASHTSLRDDYQVSAPELDVAVQAALDAGALGARMTGGGFGGSAIALVRENTAGSVASAVESAYAATGFTPPTIRPVRPVGGARRER